MSERRITKKTCSEDISRRETHKKPTMKCVVTIDGPAGAGKSTVARRLAERLGWRFLDTGAMYRAVTLAAIRGGTKLTSEAALAALVESLTVRLPPGRVFLGNEDITQPIRGVEVTQASKFVADSPSVRGRLTSWQRDSPPNTTS